MSISMLLFLAISVLQLQGMFSFMGAVCLPKSADSHKKSSSRGTQSAQRSPLTALRASTKARPTVRTDTPPLFHVDSLAFDFISERFRPRSNDNIVDDMVDPIPQRFTLERPSSSTEMAVMSAAGLALTAGVIYTLAATGETEQALSTEGGSETLKIAYANVMDAALPGGGTDAVAIVIGEAIGGFIGAFSTAIVPMLYGFNTMEETVRKSLLAGAVADSDYFVARAAALPLLEAFGVPKIVASLSSVLLATVPYEMVKLGSKQSRNRQLAEDRMMQQLLTQEGVQRRSIMQGSMLSRKPKELNVSVVDFTVEEPFSESLDVPEVLADIIKWLEFDLLRADFAGTLGCSNGIESAFFGFLAGLSSRLYQDRVRKYTYFGSADKRIELQERTVSEWVRLYVKECLSTAALFGVYETIKGPVSVFVSGILSGGVDGCIGSSDFNACIETYAANSPPEASPEAQFRSLVTALVSFADRLQLDASFDTQVFIRGEVVQFYNILAQILAAQPDPSAPFILPF